MTSGMECVDRLRKGDPNENGAVPYPDRIIRLQVAADAEKNGTAKAPAPAAKPAPKAN